MKPFLNVSTLWTLSEAVMLTSKHQWQSHKEAIVLTSKDYKLHHLDSLTVHWKALVRAKHVWLRQQL